jgi:hypothetical protein
MRVVVAPEFSSLADWISSKLLRDVNGIRKEAKQPFGSEDWVCGGALEGRLELMSVSDEPNIRKGKCKPVHCVAKI